METTAVTTSSPKVGSQYEGGIYAGIIAGKDGAPDYHLIVATPDRELIDLTWDQAIEQAKQPANGHQDWSLPDRREARLLAINTPDGFDTRDWYWTATQDESDPDYASIQDFSDGNQYWNRKSSKYCARAVRRLSIIE